MTYVTQRLTLLIMLIGLVTSCKEDSKSFSPEVDLTQAKINCFELNEQAYTSININHPEINNGVEVKYGEIVLVIPKGNTQLRLTPKNSNFNNDKFTISPRMGEVQDFLDKTVIYTIASKEKPEKKVHYKVTITEEQDPVYDQVEITGFKFEKSKNPALNADIAASKIVNGLGTIGKIIVFVPVGTNFSELKPTIEYSGAGLYYSQDEYSSPANSTTPYPSAGLLIDFAYPKKFYLVVKAGSVVKEYDVIVDVKNPIKFSNAAITTANVAKGAIRYIPATTFTNQGNHPISISSVSHINQQPSGLNVIRASTGTPSFGLKPNQSAQVNVTISAQTYPPGTYQTTAVFLPKLYNKPEADGLMETSRVTITSTITD